MTVITLEPNHLSVVGHAGYGKVGYDIVCAGISTLILLLLNIFLWIRLYLFYSLLFDKPFQLF